MASQQASGPPYVPQIWTLGGPSVKHIDIPVTAVLLALFIGGAVTHMTIFQLNNRRGHKFVFSAMLFGFCMARITTCVLRIASISLPTNIRLAIAAQVFVAAGVLLVFVINLLWTQRLVRSLHPKFGWHPIPSTVLKVVYVLIVFTLAMVITATVQSFYTLRPRTRKIDRSIQLYGATFLAIISFLPIPILTVAFLVPRKQRHDKFGRGRLRTKVAVLLTGTALVTFGAWYRCGTSWAHPVPRTKPLPSYFHKAAFYIANFGVEILTVYLYAIMRVDLRFHIPNGARGAGSYSAEELEDGEAERREAEIANGNATNSDVGLAGSEQEKKKGQSEWD